MRGARFSVVRPLVACWVLAGIVGCAQLLGLKRVEGDGCEVQSDCPDGLVCTNNVCSAQCLGDSDCSSGESCGESQMCTASIATEAGIPPRVDTGALVDATPFADPDATLPADATPPPADPDATPPPADPDATPLPADPDATPPGDLDAMPPDGDAGCGGTCPALTECVSGQCEQGNIEGVSAGPSAGGFTFSYPYDIYCFQQQLLVHGDLVGVGFELGTSLTGNVRLGVYSDNGGAPSTKLAETADTAVNGTSAQISVSPAASVGYDTAHDYYWICMVSSTPGVLIKTLDGTSTNWVEMAESWEGAENSIDGGLPGTWSSTDSGSAPSPFLYMLIVSR